MTNKSPSDKSPSTNNPGPSAEDLDDGSAPDDSLAALMDGPEEKVLTERDDLLPASMPTRGRSSRGAAEERRLRGRC